MRIKVKLAVTFFFCFFVGAALSKTQEDNTFLQAYKAAKKGNTKTTERLINQLKQYPLINYLHYEVLKKKIAQVSAKTIDRFLQQNTDSPLNKQLLRHWLKSLTQRKLWSLYRKYYQQKLSVELDCYYQQALLNLPERQRPQNYLKDLTQLWLTPKSQPKACDIPFSHLRNQLLPKDWFIWQRIELAIQSDNISLANYLKRYLSKQNKIWFERWKKMHYQPYQTLLQTKSWPKKADNTAKIASYGIKRLAKIDLDKALQLMPKLKLENWLESGQLLSIKQFITLQTLVNDHPSAFDLANTLSKQERTHEINAWAVRVALKQKQWQEVIKQISLMLPSQQEKQEWQFWHAYAEEKLGKKNEAQKRFETLANNASYYGFLASDQINKDYTICPAELKENNAIQAELEQFPGLQRSLLLWQLGLKYEAVREWRLIEKVLSKEENQQAAITAFEKNWYYQTIKTLADIGEWQTYSYRFPLSYQQEISRLASSKKIDETLIFAIIRAESAFRDNAYSSSGAIGLMQLMPKTARMVAKKEKIPAFRSRDLYDPKKNIHLGSTYFAELLDQFNQQPIKAIASYNAGPNRVKRWQNKQLALPPEIWIETINYKETREYVKRVLAFATIYDWRINNKVKSISNRLNGHSPAYLKDISCKQT